jgi:3-deoxy-D-arabino-heptulosonate 7-phosphate (DAHP) synthase class II
MRSRGVIIRTMRQSGSKRRGRKKNHVDANNIKDTFRIVLLQMRVVLIFGGQVKVGVSLVFLEPFGC